MKRLLMALLFLFFIFSSGCFVIEAEEDEYCFEQCISQWDDIVYAEWHGNDDMMGVTRCGCIGSDGLMRIYYAPLLLFMEG